MQIAEANNAMALPEGYFPMRETTRGDGYMSLVRGGSAGTDFHSLLGNERADRAADAEPIMFPSRYKGTQESLSDRLGAVRAQGKGKKDELREAAEQMVSTTLIMPLFDQLRSDPLAANMFHGGQAESVFRRQLDQTLADRIAGSSGFDLVDSIYNQFAAYAAGSGGGEGKGVNIRA